MSNQQFVLLVALVTIVLIGTTLFPASALDPLSFYGSLDPIQLSPENGKVGETIEFRTNTFDEAFTRRERITKDPKFMRARAWLVPSNLTPDSNYLRETGNFDRCDRRRIININDCWNDVLREAGTSVSADAELISVGSKDNKRAQGFGSFKMPSEKKKLLVSIVLNENNENKIYWGSLIVKPAEKETIEEPEETEDKEETESSSPSDENDDTTEDKNFLQKLWDFFVNLFGGS